MASTRWSRLVHVAGSAFLVLALAACSSAPSTKPAETKTPAADTKPVENKPLTKVKLSYLGPDSSFFAPYVGIQSGIYKKHGLDVEMVKLNVATGLAALDKGDVQFNMSVGSMIGSIIQGAQVKMVAVVAEKANFFLVGSKAIANLEALKVKLAAGEVKMAGSGPGGTDDSTIRDMLVNKGFSKELVAKIKTIPMTEDAVMDASLKQGLVDLVVTAPPSPFVLNAAGYPLLLSPKDDPLASPNSAISVSTKFFTEKPELVKAMIAGTIETMQWMKQNKEPVKKMMVDWMGFTDQTAELGYQSVIDVLSLDGATTWETIERVKERRRVTAKITQNLKANEIFDFGPLWEVQKQMNLPQRPTGTPQ